MYSELGNIDQQKSLRVIFAKYFKVLFCQIYKKNCKKMVLNH